MRPYSLFRSAVAAVALSSMLAMSVSAGGQAPPAYQRAYATPLAADSGSSAVWQDLQKLKTRASLMMIVAHPDDEDGGMLAYESRKIGADASLLTLNRGEGGQNDMSSDYWDQLGLVRTQELLAAGDAYGVHQYWTRVADFGFSKSIEEALKTWGHDRVLYDCVRVVRMTRPMIVTSSFVGNVSDGHGHHQVSGLMAQEVFKAAADPNVFPDQIAAGLKPWAPLKVYARAPFARITEKGIYDYATGHWQLPVRFKNYVTGEWINGVPSTTVEVPEGDYNPLFGESYVQLARQGLNQQKTQNGGTAVPPAGPTSSPYHLYATRVTKTVPEKEKDFFEGIDVTLAGIADYAPAAERATWKVKLNALNATVTKAAAAFDGTDPAKTAPELAKGLTQTRTLLAEVAASKLPEDAKYNMTHELDIKETQFNAALGHALGMSLAATASSERGTMRAGPMGSMGIDAAGFQTVIPGQTFQVTVHVADQGTAPVEVVKTAMIPNVTSDWKIAPKDASIDGPLKAGDAANVTLSATVPSDAAFTRPYFSRPNLEQSYYDIDQPKYLNLPTMPYPLTAEVTYKYGGVEASVSGVVQTIHRFTGPGPLPEPLLVAPAISLTVSPEAGVVPLSAATLQLQVTVHSSVKGAAKGEVKLDLPAGWVSEPATIPFATSADGDERIVNFKVTPKQVEPKPYTITAVANYKGQEYKQGFVNTGYVGRFPYPYYRDAAYKTTGVDVKVAPGLKVGYIMGTGEDVPAALEEVGVHVNLLSTQDVTSADLSSYDAIVIGIRAYGTRPELKGSNMRLLDYVKNGGVVVVEYQAGDYDHNYGPYPLTLSADAEKVVEEDSKVTLLAPNDPVFNWPNKITTSDFDGWVEERGHGFMREWDSHYTALTEMHDGDQDPQKGGLIYAHYGSGAYVYLAYAFFREMPEGVPGSFRIMSNLISLKKNPGFQAAK
jgi:LmbE family N-acetylglucosaminyl deacetylase